MSYKTDTDNFLHTNPSLYLAFHDDDELSMARFVHRVLVEYKAGSRVLDVGSGPGREVAYLHRAGYEAIGLDNSQEMLGWARALYPGLQFEYGSQSDFALDRQFDALICVGSTFLYNFTNSEVLASLRCFRQHLREGGLLYLDMRNAAFFLTEEGRRWLTEELKEHRTINGETVTMTTRFGIDPVRQLLEREYCWPGIGKYALDSILVKDYPVIQSYALVAVLMVVLIHFFVDVVYSALDPRIHHKGVAGREEKV